MWASIVEQGRALLAACRLTPTASFKTKHLEIKGATAAEVNKMMQEYYRLTQQQEHLGISVTRRL